MADNSPEEKTTLTAQAAWLVLGKTLAFVLAFALPLLLVRRLSQSEFGLYKQVFLLVGTAMTLLPLGFHMSAYYFFPREPERQPQVIFNILLFMAAATALACAAIALWPTALSTIFNNPEVAAKAPLISLVVLTWVVSSLLDHVVLARQETKLAAALIVVSQLSKTLLLLGAVILYGSVRALIFAAVIQGALQTVALLLYMRSRFGAFWRGFDPKVLRRQLAYALPLGVASVLLQFQTTLDSYFVSYHFGAAAFAVYAVGCFQLPLVVILGESIGLTLIPRVSELQKQGRTREVTELLGRMARKQAALFLPMYAFMLVAGREFILLLFTEQYLASWPIFAINLTLIPLAIFATACDPIMRAYSEHRYFLLRVQVALAVLLGAALWYGVPRFGLVGAITIMVGVNVLKACVLAAKVGRILGVTRRDLVLLRDVGKVVLAAAGAGGCAALARSWVLGAPPAIVLAVCGAVFSLAYLLFVLAFGLLTLDEREAFRRLAAQLQRVVYSKFFSPATGSR